MEILAILVLVAIGIWYGIFRPVETAFVALDEEVAVLAAERKAINVSRINKIELSDDDAKKASETLARLSKIKL